MKLVQYHARVSRVEVLRGFHARFVTPAFLATPKPNTSIRRAKKPALIPARAGWTSAG